ncbi:MAG: hypothetical protein RMX60_06545, partial [Planktomarina sp.]|nr:hypothetical protein [Planktomarina sp.]
MAHSKRLGVANFCDICPKCDDACPVKALPFGLTTVGGGTSSIQAVKNGLPTLRTVFRSGLS